MAKRRTSTRIRAQLKQLEAQLADILEAEGQGMIASAVEREDILAKIWTCRSELETEARAKRDASSLSAKHAAESSRLARQLSYDRIAELEAEIEQLHSRQSLQAKLSIVS